MNPIDDAGFDEILKQHNIVPQKSKDGVDPWADFEPVKNTSFMDALTGKASMLPEEANIQGAGVAKDIAEHITESVKHPVETAKGVIKGVPRAAAGLVELADTGISKVTGQDGTMLDYDPIKELTAPSNTAQETGVVIGGMLPVERAVSAAGPLVKMGEKFLAKRGAIGAEKKALESITPNTRELAPTEYEDLLKAGKITPKTTTKPAEYVLSEKEIDTAKQNAHLLQSKDPVENSINVMNEIDKADKGVEKFLKENNNPFDNIELKDFLNEKMQDITDVMVDEKRLVKTKGQMIDNFIQGLPENNMENLWRNRKEFDQYIQKAFSGSPNLQKELKKGLRNGVQEFIAQRTPEGEYKSAMRKMSELFDLHDIISTKAAKEKGMNAIQAWINKNPTKAKIIGAGAAIIPTGATIYNISK